MKRILAVILTIVMLLGVVMMNTNAATHTTNTALPTATLVTNDGSPLDINGNVAQNGSKFIFTLRFDNFISIQGIDVEIMVRTNSALSTDETSIDKEKYVITDVQTFNLPSACLGRKEFDENYKYLGGDHSGVRFVDINITSKSRIVLSVNSPASTVSVIATGKYADTGETLFKIETKPKDYEILEANETGTVSGSTLPQPVRSDIDDKTTQDYFIPYGAVYTGNGDNKNFISKGTNASFENANGAKYTTFKLPRKVYDDNERRINNLVTFGASEKLNLYPNGTAADENLKDSKGAWKFGSYSEYDDYKEKGYDDDINKQTKNQHGTLMFVGDWLSLKEYYVKQGNTVQQFVRAIYKQITDAENAGTLGKNEPDRFDLTHHVSYSVPDRNNPDKTVWIDVYKLPREKYIWRDSKDGEGQLEYAIRFHNMQPNNTYTAVAYCQEPGKTLDQAQIAYSVKSIHLDDNYELGEKDTNQTLAENQEIPTFTQGTIATNGDLLKDQEIRIYTDKLYDITKYEKITIASGYQAYIRFYDSSETFINDAGIGWTTENIVNTNDSQVPNNAKYFRIVLKRPVETTDRKINPTNIPKNAVILIKK